MPDDVQQSKQKTNFEQTIWLQVVLQLFYVLVGTDPFLIYKVDHEKRKFANQHGKPPMSYEKLDRLREAWRMMTAIVCVPIGAHLSIIGGAQLLACICQRSGDSKENSDGDAEEPFEGTDDLLRELRTNMGDPLARSPQLASIIYLSVSVATILILVALPRHLRHSPIDTSATRFLMKPKVEIQQQEQQARRHLLTIETSFQFLDQRLFDESLEEKRIHLSLSSPAERRIRQRLENQYKLVHEGQSKHHQLCKFCFPSYTTAGYKRLDSFCKPLMCLLLIGGILVNLSIDVLLYLLTRASITAKHPLIILRELDINNLFGDLSWRQRVTLGEIVFMLAMSTVGICGLACGFLFQAYQQLGWVDDISKELSSLLVPLRHRMSFIADEWSGEKEADCELLRVLVHLSIFARLARRSTRMQTSMVSIFVAVAFVGTTSALTTRMLLPPDPYLDVQLPLMGSVWMYTNVTLIIASAMPSSVVRMKEVVWSILAEQTRVHDQTRGCHLDDVSPFSELWRKLVLNQEFILNNHPVRALGIRLTFKTVLHANFLLLTMVSWLRTRN